MGVLYSLPYPAQDATSVGSQRFKSGLYQVQASITPGTLLLLFKMWRLMDTLWQGSVTWNISLNLLIS